MMGLAPLEPEFKTLQEKNYPKICFHFRSVWGHYLRGGRFPPPLELIPGGPSISVKSEPLLCNDASFPRDLQPLI